MVWVVFIYAISNDLQCSGTSRFCNVNVLQTSNLGTVSTGTWNGDVITSAYGGHVKSDWNASSGNAQVLNKPTIPTAILIYGTSGVKSITKMWTGVVSPNTTNGYSIDISSASFTSIDNIQVIGAKNTSTISSSPQVSVKSFTTSAVIVNITEASALTTTILGVTVLSGGPLVFASTSGLTLHVRVEGN